jgi:hypothetical protein
MLSQLPHKKVLQEKKRAHAIIEECKLMGAET